MKLKISLILMIVTSLCLEAFGKGAVCVFATPDDRIVEVYSYFSLIPFGYANFAPLITAALTCVLAVLAVLTFTAAEKKVTGSMRMISAFSVLISFVPLIMLGAEYYNVTSFFISLLMILQLIVIILIKRGKGEKANEA